MKSRRYKNLEHIAVTEGERLVICSSVKNLEVFDVAKKSSVNIISAAHMGKGFIVIASPVYILFQHQK